MKKRYWILIILGILIIATLLLGPSPKTPELSENFPVLPNDLEQLDVYVTKKEAEFPVREDNQARIKWYGDTKEVTEYSVVYLHGFAGSYRDGYPANVDIADTIGANIFLARWGAHGLKPEQALKDFSGDLAWEDAKEALEIGRRIGRKVIIMSTSTGGTLAIKLAATYPDAIHAIINLSPNIEDDQPGTFVLNSPWGYEIAKLVSFGENRKIEHEQSIATQYWDTIYPSRALVDLQVLVETTMTPETFAKVKCPVLTLYYKENFIEKDSHVEVSSFPEAHAAFSTPDSINKLIALETPQTHFIGSDIKSKDYKIVEDTIISFLSKQLNISIKN